METYFYHVPGLKVVRPSTPADAKGLLKSAIRDDNPVIFIEAETLYAVKGEVPEDPDFLIPLGKAVDPARGHRRHGGRLHGHDVPRARGRRGARQGRHLGRDRRPAHPAADGRRRPSSARCARRTGRSCWRRARASRAWAPRSRPRSPRTPSTISTRPSSASPARTRRCRTRKNLELLKTPSKAKIAAPPSRRVCNAMITKVLMPKLSDAMETGKVIKWLKKEGDAVKGGDILVEVETDKANVEIEAFGGGVLRKIVIAEGGTVPVGELIARDRGPGGGHLERRRQPGPAGARGSGGPGRRGAGRHRAGRASRARRRRRPPPRPPGRSPRWRATSRRPRRPRWCRWPRRPPRRPRPPAGASRPRRSRARSRAQTGVDLRLIQGAARAAASSARTWRRPGPRRARSRPRPRRPPRRAARRRCPRGPRSSSRPGPRRSTRTSRCRRCAPPSPSACRCRRRRSRTSTSPPRSTWTRRGRSASSSTALEGQPKVSVERHGHQGLPRWRCSRTPGSTPSSTGEAIRGSPPGAHRHRGGARAGADHAGAARLRRQAAGPDRGRGARPGRARARRKTPSAGDVRGHLLDLQPRHVRRRASSRPSSTRPRAPSSRWAPCVQKPVVDDGEIGSAGG